MPCKSRPFSALRWALWLFLSAFSFGCKCSPEATAVPPRTPTLRIYLLSSPAGALEPCGCVKDMLGGVDHLAAYLKSQTTGPRAQLLLGAGPLFFTNSELAGDRRTQDTWKADALARAFGAVGLAGWAPGANDWAAGSETLVALASTAQATPLACNLTGLASAHATRLFQINGTQVGVVGISLPRRAGKLPEGVASLDAQAELVKAKAELDRGGARVRILLAAMPRGDALRLLDAVPGFQIALIGKAFDEGETNDLPTPPDRVGKTLVIETPNHLQAVAELDLFVRGDSFEFEDAANSARAAERQSLATRIQDLESRLANAEKLGAPAARDVTQGRADVARLRAELAKLEAESAPTQGSFYRYRLQEIRENLGSDATAHALLQGYYARVNAHNREVFQDRVPKPAAAGESSYVGGARCAACHQSEQAFWEKTQHAQAYATLSSQSKEFNLDCVSCHVTGYDRPGGSTVTHVAGLENVQCENCHGPGSRHSANPAQANFIQIPERGLCAGACHHPPHVKADWSVDLAWPKIIGPGHMKQQQ